MKIYTLDKQRAAQAQQRGDRSRTTRNHRDRDDVSLCKIKVKPQRSRSQSRSRDPLNTRKNQQSNGNGNTNTNNTNTNTNGDDLQEYVVASKKRTVVLQFESPTQRRKKNKKMSKLGRGRAAAVGAAGIGGAAGGQGAVRGIKNLAPVNNNNTNNSNANNSQSVMIKIKPSRSRSHSRSRSESRSKSKSRTRSNSKSKSKSRSRSKSKLKVTTRTTRRSFVEKARSPPTGLEGTFIEFDENNLEILGTLGDGSFDKASRYDGRGRGRGRERERATDVQINDDDDDEEEDYDENNWVDLDEDDNYYRSFLKSIQCRVSVKQLECNGGSRPEQLRCIDRNKVECFDKSYRDDMNMNPDANGGSLVQNDDQNLLVAWSGEKDLFNDGNMDNSQIEEVQVDDLENKGFNSIETDVYESGSNADGDDYGNILEEGPSGGADGDDDDDDDGIINNDAKNQNTTQVEGEGGWKVMSNFLGGIMTYNACGDTRDIDPTNDRKVKTPKQNRDVGYDDDEMSVESLEPPTALYAAIGTKTWNIALRRLMDYPDEATMWVSSGTSDNGTLIQFLPLHLACLTNAPLLLITLLVQAYPDALFLEAMGKLPIHLACENQVDHRIVFLLVNRHPESLQVKDDEGNTPIQVASLSDATKERRKIIQVLTKKMENTVVTVPTALYDAIDCQNWNYAIRRLVEMPQESTVWVSFRKRKTEVRYLPLHAACEMGAPLFLVQDLIQAYPDATRKKNTQGKLPLHVACKSLVDHRIVQALVEQYPDGLNIKDYSGSTPLEIVSKMHTSPEKANIMDVLEEAVINNDQEKVVFCPTKLYTLIGEKNWDVAVRRVLEAPDEASMWVGVNETRLDLKCLPLHLACNLKAPLILVAVLIQTYPDSVKKKTSSGKLPLHIACEMRADHRVISFLLHTWPDSFHVKDKKGQTCVQYALLSKSSEQRTKNVEVLMTFEGKDGDKLVAYDVNKDIEENNKTIKEVLAKHKEEGENDSETEWKEVKTLASKGLMSRTSMTKTYYTKKKSLFKRKTKKKSLWESDKDMFANE